jgi:hypothetical protein
MIDWILERALWMLVGANILILNNHGWEFYL